MAIIVLLSSVKEYEFEMEVCFYVVWYVWYECPFCCLEGPFFFFYKIIKNKQTNKIDMEISF